MKAPRVLVALACVAFLTGCSGGAATGGDVDLNAKGGPGNLLPSASAKATAKKVAPKVAPKKVVTKAPVAVRTTAAPPKTAPVQKAPEAQPFRVTINGDKSGKALIDPPQVAVFSGTKVIWTNADTKPHGVQAQNGAFNSGNIAPGASYTWIAGAAGMYAYADSTRPYVNAQIQVSPR